MTSKFVTLYPPIEVHDGPVKVFNDPIYCDDGIKRCPSLDKPIWQCDLFTGNPSLLKNDMLRWFYKCEQCKELFKKSLSKEDNADRELGTT